MYPAREKLAHVSLIVAFAVAAVAPMLFFGVPGGNDAVQHYEFAQQVVDAIRQGDLFPSFASNSNHGLGDAGLRVYPPAAYYLLAAAYFVAGGWYYASLISFFLIFLIGAIGTYLWVKESFSRATAMTAAGISCVMPFHLNEIYNNFLYAEFAASAVLPFCFLFTARSINRGRLIDSICLAVALAVLIITHLPMTIIGSLALTMYAASMLKRENLQSLANLAGSLIASVAMSSFYWVRMVSEMDWVKHSAPQYFANTWSYSENFLFSSRTVNEFLNDGLALWFGDIILFVTALVCVPATVCYFRRSEAAESLRPIVILLGLAVFMSIPLSIPLWDNFPLLQKVQFPWRWLSIVSLAGSVAAAYGLVRAAEDLKEVNNKKTTLGIAAAVLPFVILSAFIVRAPHYTALAEFENRAAKFSAGETFEGWWPIWARREAFSGREKVIVTGRSVTVGHWKPLERTFTVEAGEHERVTVATFYYPHWKARIDGRSVEVAPDQLGLITFEVPAETVNISLQFEEPVLVKWSIWLSAACWLTLLGTALILFRRTSNYGTYR